MLARAQLFPDLALKFIIASATSETFQIENHFFFKFQNFRIFKFEFKSRRKNEKSL